MHNLLENTNLHGINRKNAVKIMDFVQENAPFGSTNFAEGKIAKDKILAIRNGFSSELNFEDLDNENATPWVGPTEGLKSVISYTIQEKQTKNPVYTLTSIDDIFLTAKEVFTYGTGRCIGLACLGLIYALKELQNPSVNVVLFGGELNHTLLLIGQMNIHGKDRGFVLSDMGIFCDPWTKTIGTKENFLQHLQEQNLNVTSGQLPSILNDVAIQKEIITKAKTMVWPEEEQKKHFQLVEEIYQRFLKCNQRLREKYATFETEINSAFGKKFNQTYIETRQAKWDYYLTPEKIIMGPIISSDENTARF